MNSTRIITLCGCVERFSKLVEKNFSCISSSDWPFMLRGPWAPAYEWSVPNYLMGLSVPEKQFLLVQHSVNSVFWLSRQRHLMALLRLPCSCSQTASLVGLWARWVQGYAYLRSASVAREVARCLANLQRTFAGSMNRWMQLLTGGGKCQYMKDLNRQIYLFNTLLRLHWHNVHEIFSWTKIETCFSCVWKCGPCVLI